MFYDTSSTYRGAYGKLFRSGTLLPDGSSSVPFFGFVLFVLFLFYFWLVSGFSLVPDCTTSQRKFSPAVKYPLFRCSVYLFGVAATLFFLFIPCTHSRKVEQTSMVLRRRPFHHKDANTREALPATLASQKFSWSSSAIWTIFTSSQNDFFRSPNTEWPKARTIGWQLVLDFLFMLRKGTEMEKKPKRYRSIALSVDVDHAGIGNLTTLSSTRVPVLHHSNALS